MVLPKKQKLKNRSVFRKAYQLKTILKNEYFRLIGQKRALREEKLPLIGIVLSRKKVKLANKRNLIKRRLEEAYRLSLEKLKTQIYLYEYLIFLPEANCLNASFEELKIIIENMKK